MITIECDACFKNYRVKPEMAGKRAKCKCGALIPIPGGQSGKRQRAAGASPDRAKPQRRPRPKPQPDPWDEDPHPDDDFDDDFGDDFGYDDDYDEPPRRPRRSNSRGTSRKGRGRSSKRRRKHRSGSGFSGKQLAGLIFLGVVVMGMLVGFMVKPVGVIVGSSAMIICFALMLGGSLMCMISAFQEDVVCGLLWLFVPFYSLYYVITRFSELVEYLMYWAGGLIGVLICSGYLALIGGM